MLETWPRLQETLGLLALVDLESPLDVRTKPICLLTEYTQVLATRIHSMAPFVKQAMWLTILIFIASMPHRAVCYVRADSDCGHSSVEDAWRPEYASRARLFLAELQRVVGAMIKNNSLRLSNIRFACSMRVIVLKFPLPRN